MSDSQVKNSFDKVSLEKVMKGALIAGTGAFALFILSWLGTVEISNPMMAGLATWFVPFAVNAIKEFMKGD